MNTIWERLYPLLSEEKKEEFRKRFKKKFGVEFIPPKPKPKLESPAEMKKIMEEAPNYPIESKGRE